MAEAVAIPARASFDELDPRRIVTWGLLAGAAMVFVAVIGMVESFSDRLIIDPVLGLGYLALFWLPVAFAYRATYQEALEGIEAPPTGIHNVAGGGLAGLLSGGVMALLILVIDNVELRDIFPNVSTALLEQLTFDRTTGFGILVMVGGGAALGAVGGGLHLLSDRSRRAAVSGIVWTAIIALLELAAVDILEELPGPVEEWLYSGEGGLSWGGAIAVFAVTASLSYAAAGRASLRARVSALPEHQRTGVGLVAAFAFIALGFALPSMLDSFLNEILSTVGLFLLMGLGLNIVIGLAGLLDLGYVAFFAVGAYATAVLTTEGGPKLDATWPFVLAVPAVIVAAIIAGILVGTPVIRMRGDYLAIVTLGFGEIARILFLSDWLKPTFGGAQGILQIPSVRVWRWVISLAVLAAAAGVAWFAYKRIRRSPDPPAEGVPDYESRIRTLSVVVAVLVAIGAVAVAATVGLSGTFDVRGTQPQLVFYAVFFFAIVAAFISWRLQESRIGRAWMAMREDEQVAEAMGINTVTAKLLAFVTGAVLASFAGALFSAKIGSIFPNSFALIVSIIVLVLIIVGGMGNIPGVAIGALVLLGVLGGPASPGLLREFEDFKLLIYGALLIYMMLRRPEGLLPSVRRTRELHQEEFMQDAWVRGEGADEEQEGAPA